MKLFVNGCSHTAGTIEALDGDFTQTWPNVLNTLGFSVKDASFKGCSNDRIMRSSTSEILDNKYDFAAIQWTFTERFETPAPKQGAFKQHLPHAALNKYDGNPHLKFFEEYYYRSTKTQKLLDLRFVHQLYSMQLILEANNIDYCFIIWCPIHREILRDRVFKQINTNKILNYKDGQVIGMDNILHDNGFKLSKKPIIGHEHLPDMHYMADAHRFIASQVYKHIDSV